MDPITDNPAIQLLGRHRSVRRYTGEPIPAETLAAVLRAGQGAASSSFIQAYSIVRVTRPAARAVLARAAGGQRWVEEAAEFLVLRPGRCRGRSASTCWTSCAARGSSGSDRVMR